MGTAATLSTHSLPAPHPPPAQPEKIKHLLDNVEMGTGKGQVQEKTEGMKYLLAVRRVAVAVWGGAEARVP